MNHYLIAISVGFRSVAYVKRKLDGELSPTAKLTILAERERASDFALDEWAEDISWIDARALSRSNAREIVRTADKVIAFWDGESLSQIVLEATRLQKDLKLYPVEVTKVVNRDRDSFDVYIGRGSLWGNPFRLGEREGEFTREQAINLFRKRFEEELLREPATHLKALALRGHRLGCYCKPLPCHGDVIADYLNSLDPENLPAPSLKPQQTVPQFTTKSEDKAIAHDPENATHLFISYAVEDVLLAKWLSRKLAANGYAVWFDQLKLLGGEPWPQSIDDAIKNRTFRMIALLSSHSLYKQNPSKERALALAIARRRGITDFLIPLKVDSAELDWLTNDISYISFRSGWAEGLRQLLKKLEAVSAPRHLSHSASLVRQSLPQGDDLLVPTAEALTANVVKVKNVPLALRAFQSSDDLTDDQLDALGNEWPFFRLRSDYFLAFHEPRSQTRTISPTKEQWSWVDIPRIHGIPTRNIISNLILRTLHVRILHGGCLTHPKQRGTYYLPKSFTSDGLLRFFDYRQKKTWVKIRGTTTFIRPGKPREQNFHHFAFRVSLGRGLDANFWIQITPSLFFFDANDQPIVDKRVGARRRRLTKNWWNNKWLNRLLATEQILLALEHSEPDISLKDGLLRLDAPISINERAFTDEIATDGDDTELVIEDLRDEPDEDEQPSADQQAENVGL